MGKVGATAVIWRRAGTFKAFKIRHTVRSIGNPGRIDYTLWYAPEICRFVKGTRSEPALTFELAR